MKKKLSFAVGLFSVTLLWSAIVALEGPVQHYICGTSKGILEVVCNLFPYLRGPGEWPPEWRWWLSYPVAEGGPLFDDIVPVRILILLLVAGLLISWWLWARKLKKLTILHLSVLSGLGFILILAVQFLSNAGIPLMARLIGPIYEPGYFLPAAEIDDPIAFLSTYANRMQENSLLNPRLNTHPPGRVMFFWFFIRLAEMLPSTLSLLAGPFLRAHTLVEWADSLSDDALIAAAMAGLAVPALAALATIPLYFFGSEIVGSYRARLASVLYLLAPALPVFAPTVDMIDMLIAIFGLWLAYLGFSRQSHVALFCAGTIFSLLLFMSFSNLPFILMAALFGVGLAWNPPAKRLGALKKLLPQGLAALAGAASIWIALSINPLQMYRYASANHLIVTAERSYWAWVLYGPYDLLYFVGLPAAVLFIRAIVRLGRKSLRGDISLSTGEIWLASLVFSMALLFITGKLRGEAARILMFCYPLILLAGQVKSDKMSEKALSLLAVATLCQNVAYYYSVKFYPV